MVGGRKGGHMVGPKLASATCQPLPAAACPCLLQPRQAVEACLGLQRELLLASAHQPVLFALDDYNALHWTTEYGASSGATAGGRSAVMVGGAVERRELSVEELPLVWAGLGGRRCQGFWGSTL